MILELIVRLRQLIEVLCNKHSPRPSVKQLFTVRLIEVSDVFSAKASARWCIHSLISPLLLLIVRLTFSFLVSFSWVKNALDAAGFSIEISSTWFDSSEAKCTWCTFKWTQKLLFESSERIVSPPGVKLPQILMESKNRALQRFRHLATELATSSVTFPCTFKVRSLKAREERIKSSQRASAPSQLSLPQTFTVRCCFGTTAFSAKTRPLSSGPRLSKVFG